MQLSTTKLATDANLQGYWKLEDLTDSSTHALTLTNQNSVAFNPAKYANGADLGANNTNKALYVNSNCNIRGGSCSIAGWVKIETANNSEIWIQGDAINQTLFIITYNGAVGTPNLQFNRNALGSTTVNVTYNTTLDLTQLHHLALTNDTVNLIGYLDGNPVGTAPSSVVNGNTFPVTDRFVIGIDRDLVSNPTSAICDDVAIFDRALSAAEVQTLARDNAWIGKYLGA